MTEFGVAIAEPAFLVCCSLSKAYGVPQPGPVTLFSFVDGDLRFVADRECVAILPTTTFMGFAFPIGVRALHVGCDDTRPGRRIGAFYGPQRRGRGSPGRSSLGSCSSRLLGTTPQPDPCW